MEATVPFRKENIKQGNTLIVYGASVYGELAYIALRELGVKPAYFCDRFRTGQYFGIDIIHPSALEHLLNANIIIASCDYFDEIREQLLKQGCRNLFDMRYLLSLTLPQNDMTQRAKAMYAYRQVYDDVAEHQGELNFHRVQFVVTEKCSLKCRDCMHLMQYYQKPMDVDMDKACLSFDRLLNLVDNISELRILGGEPFIHRELYKLIDRYAPSKKIGSITIYSNGTIVPNERNSQALKNSKVTVNISNYIHNEKRIRILEEKLKEQGIVFFVRSYDSWQDCGDLSNRGYSQGKKEELFLNCFERGCYTFYKGQLHRCPRSVHAMNLGAMPDVKQDYVDFAQLNTDDDELVRKLYSLRAKTWIEACNYCQGPNILTQHLTPAIQTSEPLPYERVQ